MIRNSMQTTIRLLNNQIMIGNLIGNRRSSDKKDDDKRQVYTSKLTGYRYQIWDKKSDIFTPDGKKFTAQEWADKYPWIKEHGEKMVIRTGIINGSFAVRFSWMVAYYKERGAYIHDDMTDDEVLRAIEEFEFDI